MEEKKSLITWVKEHKTELIILSITIVGTVLVVKNWDTIKGVFNPSKSSPKPDLIIEPVVEKVLVPVAPVVSKDFIDNLTGIKFTATELGDKVWCSAQAINKRIVATGLATKLPCGEYSLTEVGSLLGEQTKKTTRYGHAFSNIEWDAKVLEIIFSEEELLEIANKQKFTLDILNRPAA